MSGDDVALWVRARIKDMHKVNVSDFELRAFIGMVQQWIFNIAADMGSPLTAKKAELTLTAGEVALPTDFHKIRSAKAGDVSLSPTTPDVTVDGYTYNILGNTFYSENTTVDMVYYRIPEMPATLAATLELGETFRTLMANGVVALVGGVQDHEVQILLKSQLGDIIARRELPVTMVDTPWQV